MILNDGVDIDMLPGDIIWYKENDKSEFMEVIMTEREKM